MPPPTPSTDTPAPKCDRCLKPLVICVCDRIRTMTPRTEVLILQHPQEMDELLGTARITEISLARTKVHAGLSWSSLSHAAQHDADPTAWGILYLGSLKKELTAAQLAKPLVQLDRFGEERLLHAAPLRGIVVLDGTWSQAKTLWWRNPWMLKLNRIVLHPREPSAYGKLRAQSQKGHLSTLEAVAETLTGLGESEEIAKQLKMVFRTMLQRLRDAQAAGDTTVPPPASVVKRTARAPKRKGSRGGGPMD